MLGLSGVRQCPSQVSSKTDTVVPSFFYINNTFCRVNVLATFINIIIFVNQNVRFTNTPSRQLIIKYSSQDQNNSNYPHKDA